MEIVDRVLFREISWVLLVKLCALVLIKIIFFSNPVAGHLTDTGVQSAILGPASEK